MSFHFGYSSTDLMNGFYLLILSSKAFFRFVKLDSRNAWKQLGNMTPEVAMERYINLVSENIPGWTSKAPPVSTWLYCELWAC